MKPTDQLTQQLAAWPEQGLTFEELARRVAGDYDEIRDSIFALLSGPNPTLRQEFDAEARVMRIYRVAA